MNCDNFQQRKLNYHNVYNGDRIADLALHRFDAGMAKGLESTLWDPLPDDSWIQATLAVDAGGLGMRDTRTIALPAFLASRVHERPLVMEMAAHCDDAGICPAALCMAAYDSRTKAAFDRWLLDLPAEVHEEVRRVLDDAPDAASTRWRSLCEGVEPPADVGDDDDAAPAPRTAGVVAPVGTEDPEHPHRLPRNAALHLQRRLTRVVDRCFAQGLMDKYQTQERWGDFNCLGDLSSKDASHEWLWAVDRHKASRLDVDDYVAAVRLRLGCGGPVEPTVCGNCGVSWRVHPHLQW